MSRRLLHVAACRAAVIAVVSTMPMAMMSRAAASSAALDPDAHVRIIAAAPVIEDLTVRLDGAEAADELRVAVPYGTASAWLHVGAGRTSLTVAWAKGSLSRAEDLRAGQAYDLLIAQPAGVTGEPAALLMELPMDRIPDDTAGLRLLSATADLGSVRLTVDDAHSGPTASPFEASNRLVAAPGPVVLHVGAASTSEVFRDIPVVLKANTLSTVVWLGAGEYPLHVIVLTDAVQPPHPPPPSAPINTGDAPSEPSRLALGPEDLLLVTLGLAVIIGRSIARPGRRRARHGAPSGVALVMMMSPLLVGCGPTPGGSAGQESRGAHVVPVEGAVGSSPAAETSTEAGETGGRWVLSFPALGLEALRLTPVSAVDLPILFKTLPRPSVGWIDGTSEPGAPGVSVLVGHNTTRADLLAVFEHLDAVQPGAVITLSGTSASGLDLIVRANEVFPLGDLPADLYNAATTAEVLLVTCAGAWDDGLRTHSRVLLATPAGW